MKNHIVTSASTITHGVDMECKEQYDGIASGQTDHSILRLRTMVALLASLGLPPCYSIQLNWYNPSIHSCSPRINKATLLVLICGWMKRWSFAIYIRQGNCSPFEQSTNHGWWGIDYQKLNLLRLITPFTLLSKLMYWTCLAEALLEGFIVDLFRRILLRKHKGN